MSSAKGNSGGEPAQAFFVQPSFGPRRQMHQSNNDSGSRLHRRRLSRGDRERHIHLQPGYGPPRSPALSIYTGSYAQRSRGSLKTPGSSAPGTPRRSLSHSQIESLLQDLNIDLETYNVEELRDGFFDGFFFKPPKVDHENLMRDAECTLPSSFQKRNPLSVKYFFPKQWHEIKSVVRSVITTRAGIKLTKSFLAFFIAYILCLVPTIRNWLGRYSYIMVLSTIINHPSRTVGAQIDGALLTIIGTATGLGWGAFALWLSDSTSVARRGYGGILAMFLVLFMGVIAALRSYYIRLYQLVLCAGISICYTCLADTAEHVNWSKLFNFGIPWLLGQALCLLVCCTVFPDAGARPLAIALHDAFGVMQDGLVIPQPNKRMLHRQLAWTFVNLSQAYRDLVLDISITRFQPSEVEKLRNLLQAILRSLLSLRMKCNPFEDVDGNQSQEESDSDTPEPIVRPTPSVGHTRRPAGVRHSLSETLDHPSEIVIDVENPPMRPPFRRTETEDRAFKLVAGKLAAPTSDLLSCMRSSLARCDAVLMDMSGYRKYLGPPKSVSTDILGALKRIRKAMIRYDEEEDTLMENPALPPTYSDHPEVVELFLFVHPIRQAATNTEALLVKVMEMQQKKLWWRLYLPSYPFAKALQRTNAQVRHDRGGLTAGFYFRSQTELAKMMKGMANVYKPLPHDRKSHESTEPTQEVHRTDTIGKYEEEEDFVLNPNSHASKPQKLRYRLWVILHRLQGFEVRFGLKAAIVSSLLSVPAWLGQSRGWWNQYESWWAVVMVWIMMHPRVGGNFQDLVTRALCGILGAVWGGLAYRARNGDPYVMAVFAALYMAPMIYRFTLSSHPRSGIVGCISFVIVSLGAKAADGLPSVFQIAWTRGLAIVIGVVAAVVVNWILWPFVARHELRKALSAMLIYSSIIYRGVVAKYVYYEMGEEPTKDDIQRSEMLEGRLREGFVRIRQLMALTRHEIRLRGPFNALPYSALIDGCERFFEYLVTVRQSSIFFHPHFISDNEQAVESLLAYRRDAVASILMNLYILAGALRGDNKVPRYLPSAAAARKRLLDHMAILEAEQAQNNAVMKVESESDRRKWSQIYSYSYSQSLTGCVKQLEQLQRYTKEIVGEQGFEIASPDVYGDLMES